jgi:SpoVK/Ycf46/Vps4 family AAA+-type ATPase
VEAREEMVKSFIPNRSSEIKPRKIAEMLELYSGSDIKSFCKEALMRPLRRFIDDMRLPGGKFKKLSKPGKQEFPSLILVAKLEEVTEQDIMLAL